MEKSYGTRLKLSAVFLGMIGLLSGLTAIWLVSRAQALDDIETGVFRLAALKPGGQIGGTGFLVSGNDLLATNYHVVRGADLVSVVLGVNGELESIPAKIEFFDIETDLAVLRTERQLPGNPFTLAPAPESAIEKRDTVHAVGFPGAADDLARAVRKSDTAGLTRVDPTVTSGTVQRFLPDNSRLMIQHSAVLSPGNSGGPLFDECSRVVGVNTFSSATTIPNAEIVEALRSGRDIGVDTLGSLASAIDVSDLTLELQALDFPYTTSKGRCRFGMTPFELGASSALAATAFLMLAAAVGFGAAGAIGGRRARSDFLPTETHGDKDIGKLQQGNPSSAPNALPFPERSAPEPVIAIDGGEVEHIAEPPRKSHVISDADTNEDGAIDTDALFDLAADKETASARASRLPNSESFKAGGNPNVTPPPPRSQFSAEAPIPEPVHSRDAEALDASPLPKTTDGLDAVGDIWALTDNPSSDGSRSPSVEARNDPEQQRLATKTRFATPAGTGWLLSGFDVNGNVIQHVLNAASLPADNGRLRVCILGRLPDCDISINHPSISRQHAEFLVDSAGNFSVRDLGSTNGTFIDGVKIGEDPVELSSERTLQFGENIVKISSLGTGTLID